MSVFFLAGKKRESVCKASYHATIKKKGLVKLYPFRVGPPFVAQYKSVILFLAVVDLTAITSFLKNDSFVGYTSICFLIHDIYIYINR